MPGSVNGAEAIGVTAGQVWNFLNQLKPKPVTVTRLVKSIKAPRDLIMQAVGWLAREDKLVIETRGRAKRISLR